MKRSYKGHHQSSRRYCAAADGHLLMPVLSQNAVTGLSLLLNIVLVVTILLLLHFPSSTIRQQMNLRRSSSNDQLGIRSRQVTFHGGHPLSAQTGTCFCGRRDGYCMCTPSLAIDLIISNQQQTHVWLVRRKDTSQLATMGGFVNVGESVEAAVRRELQEETGIILKENDPLQLLGVYSDPRRDNRRHTVSAVFVVSIDDTDTKPHAHDDVKDVQRISIRDIGKHDYFCDHKTILMDYVRSLQQESVGGSQNDGDFAPNVIRSTCHA